MSGVAQLISSSIRQAAGGQGLNGSMVTPMATAIGQSVAEWLPSGVTIKAATVGSAGAGVVTGNLTVPPLPGAAPLFAAQGMGGPQSWRMANAISIGISGSVSGLPYAGPSASVGTGTAVGKVTMVNQAALIALLVKSLPANFSSEVNTPSQAQMAAAIGTIVAAQLMLGFGAGAVVGTASPAGAVGTATCSVVVV